MKSIIRFGVLLMVAMLVAMPLGNIRAQGGDDMCAMMGSTGLSADDCALVQSAMTPENLAKLGSFVADYNMALKVTGTGSGDTDITVKGNGPVSFDPAALQGNDQAALLSSLMVQQSITVSGTSSGKAENHTAEFRVVDGKIYFNTSDAPSSGKWLWQSLSSAASSTMSSNPMMGMMGSGNPAAGMATSPEMMAAVQKLMAVPGFVKVSSAATGDEKAITIAIDFGALAASKDLATILKDIVKASSPSGTTMDDATLDQTVQQYVSMGSVFLKDAKLNIVEYFGTSDKLFHGIDIHIDYKLDASMAAAMMNSTSKEDVNATFDLKFHLTKIGEAVTVEAPADATEYTPSGSTSSGSDTSSSGGAEATEEAEATAAQ